VDAHRRNRERSGDRLKTAVYRITSNYFGPVEITALRVAPDFTGGIVLRQLHIVHIRRCAGEFERRDAPSISVYSEILLFFKQLLNVSNRSAWNKYQYCWPQTFIILLTIYYIYFYTDFAEIFKNLETDLKQLLGHQNYIRKAQAWWAMLWSASVNKKFYF